ncbi:hypothetical protein OPKNFCMD_6736 [Methylobacterium crusticola]|uniref:Uncharacterized protein n=1 Tax=Methylobacterium crusticola TaxID=1697972 RepID=A0ABQ4R8A6_9HYPH|nr:hypothetical protein [Methylobacterium crusticola]GJD53956.1 hypothetical protein OPKNFCMD_6736 [Methylobacterium crusticola]
MQRLLILAGAAAAALGCATAADALAARPAAAAPALAAAAPVAAPARSVSGRPSHRRFNRAHIEALRRLERMR